MPPAILVWSLARASIFSRRMAQANIGALGANENLKSLRAKEREIVGRIVSHPPLHRSTSQMIRPCQRPLAESLSQYKPQVRPIHGTAARRTRTRKEREEKRTLTTRRSGNQEALLMCDTSETFSQKAVLKSETTKTKTKKCLSMIAPRRVDVWPIWCASSRSAWVRTRIARAMSRCSAVVLPHQGDSGDQLRRGEPRGLVYPNL